LIDDGDGILQDLCRAVAIFVLRKLLLVVLQLGQQAFAKGAATYAGRIELAAVKLGL
jgi:hypothetical protein